MQITLNLTWCCGVVSILDGDGLDISLTWVERLHIAVEKTDIHTSHVNNVEQGCDDHAPESQENPDQNIDWKKQVRQQEQITPVR